jgi:hypothetical protein
MDISAGVTYSNHSSNVGVCFLCCSMNVDIFGLVDPLCKEPFHLCSMF